MPAPGRKNSPFDGLSALALVSQVGLVMATAIVGGVFGGIYLDRWLGDTGLVIALGALLGVGAGMFGVYSLLSREMPWKR